MKIIYGERCTGKTKQLIGYCLENNIPILAFSESKVQSLAAKSMEYFNTIVPIIRSLDFDPVETPVVAIDDIDEVLFYIIGAKVDIVTLNVDGQ